MSAVKPPRPLVKKMRQIADKRQVLCSTHLPQVAAAGTAQYVVTKPVKGGPDHFRNFFAQ